MGREEEGGRERPRDREREREREVGRSYKQWTHSCMARRM